MTMQRPEPRTPATATEHDKLWQPRKVAVGRSVAQYSRFVSTMKLALPSAAGFLLLLVIVLPQFRDDTDRFQVGASTLQTTTADALSMINASYFGTDDKGQPFSVTAEAVREREGADESIDLTAPSADISLTNGTWLSVGAKGGLYDRSQQVLDLSGEVSLFQDQGYELHTAAARIFLKAGNAQGSDPVSSQGPFGRLESAGFELYDKGEVVVFTGPAHLVLNSGMTSNKPRAGASAP